MSLPCPLKPASNGLNSVDVDSIVYISTQQAGSEDPEGFRNVIKSALDLDEAFGSELSVLPISLPAKRLIYSPTGPLTDYDDVKTVAEAVKKGIKRAIKAGSQNPLLVVPVDNNFPKVGLVSVLAALEALYVPIQLREDVPEKKQKVQSLSVWSASDLDIVKLLKQAEALETARVVARDIGGGDPERMTAIRVEQYVRNIFSKDSQIKIEVISDEKVLDKEYPCFAAVNRAASVIERHRGRIIYLRYEPQGEIVKTLYLVGKGITYDTGGADIKISGIMAGMSRDKCGAAAVAGFMKLLDLTKPLGVRVVGALCLARNSVGENSYVADEVVTSRSRKRIRIINTDAEGRMVMADVLCKLKEEAVNAVNAHLLTVATLTGHACLAVGHNTIVLDNSVARSQGNGRQFQSAGETLGDGVEVSTLRKCDLEHHKGQGEGIDLHQCGPGASSRTARGHQGPGAFLLMASGLDEHGLKSSKPLSYTHLDIAGSAGDLPDEPTGSPILALAGCYFPDLVGL